MLKREVRDGMWTWELAVKAIWVADLLKEKMVREKQNLAKQALGQVHIQDMVLERQVGSGAQRKNFKDSASAPGAPSRSQPS